jgi:hypothetical protein
MCRNEPGLHWNSIPGFERRLLSLGTAVVMTTASQGCGGALDLEKELDTVRSWTASVQLAAQERRSRATTTVYTSLLREKAERALGDERRALAAAARSASDRARATAAGDSLAQAIRLLSEETDR